MTYVLGKRPVLIMSDKVSDQAKEYEPQTPQFRGKLTPFDFPHIPNNSTFEPRLMEQTEWMNLVLQFPGLIRDFMMFPHEPAVLEELTRASQARINGRIFDVERLTLYKDPARWGNITGRAASDATRAIKKLPEGTTVRLRAFFDPLSAQYVVNWSRMPESAQQAAQTMVRGAWKLTSLHEEGGEVHRLISDGRIPDILLSGARILYIPDNALLAHPRIVGVSKKSDKDGVIIREMWTPRPGQERPRGSSISLLVNKGVRERLHVGDLIRTIEKAVRETRAKGLTPAIAVDLDGTVFSTRGFAAQIFEEWMHAYQGAQADEIRAIAKERGVENCWNSETVLRSFGITDPVIIQDAMQHFDANFYNADRRMGMPDIPGMVKLVRLLQSMGVKTVYVTARSAEIDTLSSGEPSSRELLKKLGIWGNKSILLRHDGEKPDWSEEAFAKGNNEPNKWEMIRHFRRSHRRDYFVAVIDNAPTHSEGYRRYFRYDIINIHVEGDLPPHSPPLRDGVFSVKPDQLDENLEQWSAQREARESELARDLLRRVEMMDHSKSSPIYLADHARLEKARERDARSAQQILRDVSQLGSWHPGHRAFFTILNERFGTSPAEILALEGAVKAINRYTGSDYAVLRHSEGIAHILSAQDEQDAQEMKIEPGTITRAALGVSRASSLKKLFEQELEALPAGPDFAAMNVSESYRKLSFSEYPKMRAALASLLLTIRRNSNKRVTQLSVLVQQPGLSLAPMIGLAATGVHVQWREPESAERFRTERELARLPRKLASRIHLLDASEKVQADLIIVPKAKAASMASLLEDLRPEGMLALQSSQDPVDFLRPESSLKMLGSLPLYHGDYVFPTSILTTSAYNAPLFFHAWRFMG